MIYFWLKSMSFATFLIKIDLFWSIWLEDQKILSKCWFFNWKWRLINWKRRIISTTTNYIDNYQLYLKLCRFRLNSTNFQLNSTNFWNKSNPNSNSESEFELSRQFRWISATISDRKCRLKADSNPIKTISNLKLIILH